MFDCNSINTPKSKAAAYPWSNKKFNRADTYADGIGNTAESYIHSCAPGAGHHSGCHLSPKPGYVWRLFDIGFSV
jgi:hypothetical protein